MSTIREKIEFYTKKIRPAKLLVVTKGRTAHEIQEVIAAGAECIGENRVQEIQRKMDLRLFHELSRNQVKLHFIGHVQSNKAGKILDLCDVVETVDSFELAKRMDQLAKNKKKILPIFLELNLAHEEQKYGFSEDGLALAFPIIQELQGLEILGFMIMGKESDRQITRAAFRRAKELSARYGVSELSMGMSDDFEIALEEGATMIRLGRLIFDSSPMT